MPRRWSNASPRGTARVATTAAIVTLAAAALSLFALAAGHGGPGRVCMTWSGAARICLVTYLDALSAAMMLLVAYIGVAVIRYSRHYLDGDPEHGRFIQWLCVALASVLLLIVSGHLLQTVLAWIAMSAALHRLLVFYGTRQRARLAARKKFLASRLGDVCIVAATLLAYRTFGSFDYAVIFAQARALAGQAAPPELTAIAILLASAGLIKSAQFPLHGWLTEVMETPTPVSALLHAGIVNAGGFLVLRFADVISLSTPALHLLALVGAVTALFGSVVMLTQTSVKAALACSTVAQMGFMMLQCGLGAFAPALLHILAHSLYKAHAFLASGSIIDLARAAWSPRPGEGPHAYRILVAAALVLCVALAASLLLGASPLARPGAFTLGAVTMLGLTHLVANAIDRRPDGAVVLRALALAAGVAAAYFALQRGAEWLFVPPLPHSQALHGALDAVLMIAVIAAFALVMIFQNLALGRESPALLKALYVHAANGFYLNTWINRLLLQRPRRQRLAEAAARDGGSR
jgi:NAD(P)H-quinone oxidoreductase subunit 5